MPPADEELPEEIPNVDHDLIDVQEFEHEHRRFVTARLAPHPTAIKVVFELSDAGEPELRSASDLVGDAIDPYFWVDVYDDLLQDYLSEVHERVDIVDFEINPDEDGPVEQAFESDSPIGRAARQSAVGVRAATATLAEVLLAAMARIGPPQERWKSNALLERFVDATLAASILEQLSGQSAIPDDVLAAWEPDDIDE